MDESNKVYSSKHAVWAIILGTLLGSSLFILFWKQGLGLNILIYTSLIFILAHTTKYVLKKKVYFSKWDLFQFPFIIIAIGTFINDSGSINYLTIALITIIFPVFLFLSIYPDTFNRFSYLNNSLIYLQQVLSPILSLPEFMRGIFKVRPGKFVTPNSLKVTLGVLMALPLMCIFTILLMSADSAFSTVIKDLLEAIGNFVKDILHLDNIWDLFLLIFFILVGIFGALGFVYAKLRFKLNDYLYEQSTKGLDMIVGNVVFSGINFIFFLFVLIQFRYLFFGGEQIAELGLTYSEYARRGFGELQVVTFFVFTLLYIVIRYAKKHSATVSNITKLNLTLLILNSLVVLFSALFRMNLYMDVYGFTLLRLYPFIFMIYEFVVFMYLIPSVYSRKVFRQFSAVTFSLFILIFSMLALVSPEKVVNKLNVSREGANNFLDKNYLLTLSSDGWSNLVEEGNNLFNCQIIKKYRNDFSDISWQDLSINKYNVKKNIETSILRGTPADEYIDECNRNLELDVEKFIKSYSKKIEEGKFEEARSEYWFGQYTSLTDQILKADFTIDYVNFIDQNSTYEFTAMDKFGRSGGFYELYPYIANINLQYNIRYKDGKTYCIQDMLVLRIQNGEIRISNSDILPLAYGNLDMYSSGEGEEFYEIEKINRLNNSSFYKYQECFADSYFDTLEY